MLTKVEKIFKISFLFIIFVNQSHGVSTNKTRLRYLVDHEDSLYLHDILRTAKAADIQSYLNEDIDPCENFYEFACSRFSKLHPSKNGMASNMLQIMLTAHAKKIEKLLNSPETSNDTAIDKKLKRFYSSCIKMNEIGVMYKSKLMTYISEFGKMPVLSGNEDWGAEQFDWIAMIAKMQRMYAKPAIIQMDVLQDFIDGNVNCLIIGEPKMFFNSKAKYFDNSTTIYRDDLISHISKRLKEFLGIPNQLAKATAIEMLNFETLLANGLWEGKEDIEQMYIPTTIQKLEQKYSPIIEIERLVNLTFGTLPTDCIYEKVESFQFNLRNRLPQVPRHIIANYLFYILLSDEFFLFIEREEQAQKKLCQEKTMDYFFNAVENMIYRHYNNRRIEKDLKILFQYLKTVLRMKFSSSDFEWMRPKARYNAIEKLLSIGFEVNSRDTNDSGKRLLHLNISNDYLENIHQLLLQEGRNLVARINEPPKSTDTAGTLSFSPAYLLQENKIKVPVASLQPYFLWAGAYPQALKFGNLGTILGQELLHGFDDDGRKIDKNGNHINWWDLESMQAFNERKKCFIDQYNQYKFSANFLHGDISVSENIADNGGLHLAYSAYINWYNDINRTPIERKLETLPQLKYNNKQLFFLSFAQLWCTDMDDYIATNTHTPNRFRVIGTLSNFPEFSKAFKCANGTTMNPEIKCKIY